MAVKINFKLNIQILGELILMNFNILMYYSYD